MTAKRFFVYIFIAIAAFAVFVRGQVSPVDQTCRSAEFPALKFTESNIFPKSRTLHRPEDGRALADGRVIVGDEDHGLVVIEKDGKLRPFGKFKEAGWFHDPPNNPAGPNGMFFERDGRHLLLVNVYTGKIYRIDIKTEVVKMVYDHIYGINSLIRDSRGTIWFTQSAKNSEENGAVGMWSAVDRPTDSGAVYYLKGSGGDFTGPAVEAAGGIYFANGIALDKAEKYLYVAETMFDRVLRFEMDSGGAALKNRETYQIVTTPDNLEFDSRGNLYIASPISNKVFAIDVNCGSLHTVFSAPSATNSKIQDEWTNRSRLGKPLLELVSPELWNPLPGVLTGMFWSQDGKTFYITGLGNAILKYELKSK